MQAADHVSVPRYEKRSSDLRGKDREVDVRRDLRRRVSGTPRSCYSVETEWGTEPKLARDRIRGTNSCTYRIRQPISTLLGQLQSEVD